MINIRFTVRDEENAKLAKLIEGATSERTKISAIKKPTAECSAV